MFMPVIKMMMKMKRKKIMMMMMKKQMMILKMMKSKNRKLPRRISLRFRALRKLTLRRL